MKSLAKNSLYNIIYQIVGLSFPLLTSVYVARIIFEDGVGRVAYAQNIASYFITIACFGFPIYGIREIAKVKEKKEEYSKIFIELFLINAVSTTVASVLYVILIMFMDVFRNEWILYLYVGIGIWLNYANIDWFYQGKEEYGYITVRNLSIKAISFIFLVLFVKKKDDYLLYALISSCGMACNYLCNLFHVRKYLIFDFNWRNICIRRHIKTMGILFISACLGSIYNKIDVTMLGAMVCDAAVGYYTNAHKIILIVVSCCVAVTTVFMPRLSYYYDRDRDALYKLIDFGTKLLFVIVIPATVGVILLASEVVVFLFGQAFAPSGNTLAIFAPMLLIRPIGDLLCYQLLISAGKEKKRIYASVLATILNIFLNCLFIPIWKQNGAAIASVIAEVLVNGLLLKDVHKIIQIKLERKFIFKTLIATLVMSVGILTIKKVLCGNFVVFFGSVVVGGILYCLVGYFIKNEIIVNFCIYMKAMFIHIVNSLRQSVSIRK